MSSTQITARLENRLSNAEGRRLGKHPQGQKYFVEHHANRRLAFLVDSGKLATRKRKTRGDYDLLPNCIIKYALLGSERTMELIQHVTRDVDITLPKLMKRLVYALCLKSTGCRIPQGWR